MEAKNQHQQVLWYLYNWDYFSLKDVINDSMFFKFQSRLSEIEAKENKELAKRERLSFTNRFGNKSSFNVYKTEDKQYIKDIFNKY